MKKYLCIVKEGVESMAGYSIRFHTKFSDNIDDIKEWIAKRYPGKRYIILINDQAMEKFFGDFQDLYPME